MQPLIDADILVYEVGSAAEYGWKKGGVPPFEYVESFLEKAVKDICAAVWATEEPILFLSTDKNFRYDVAKLKPYKGNRKHEARPWHYENIRAYMMARWHTRLCDGYEADDGLGITQYSRLEERDTIICSRDKDLRMIPGFHYTWKRGLQPEWGPEWVDDLGWLSLSERTVQPSNPEKPPYKKYKCKGVGKKFFYAQCLMGDITDNIPGLPGAADLKAYKLLNDANSEVECHKIVSDAYISIYGEEEAAEQLKEQAQLLWIVREFNPDGSLKMWTPPT